MDDRTLQIETIKFLRILLCIFVVFVHSSLGDITILNTTISPLTESTESYFKLQSVILKVIGGVSPPLFFLISGFFYFRNFKLWNWKIYLSKTRNRIITLLIPYIFWCGLVILIFYIGQELPFSSRYLSGINLPIREYEIVDFTKAFWCKPVVATNTIVYMPILGVLWFVRDLMVVSLLSPLIWFIIRYTKFLGVFCMGILWFMNFDLVVPGLSIVSFFFFSVGAYMSINNINFVSLFRGKIKLIILLSLLVIFIDYFTIGQFFNLYINRLNIVIRMICITSIASWIMRKEKIKIPNYFIGASFFIYLSHEPWLSFVKKINILVFPHTNISFFLIYICQAVLIICISLCIYFILSKLMPNFLNVITGRRIITK